MKGKMYLTFVGLTVLAHAAVAGAAMDSSKFLSQTARDGRAEVDLSQIAAEKAASPEVKQFAQRMIQDHAKMNQDVQDLAARKNIQLPTDLTAQQQAEHQKLETLSGKKFDQEFMRYNVQDHRKDVADFKRQAQQGSDPDIKQLASQSLPALESHLRMAQQVAKQGK